MRNYTKTITALLLTVCIAFSVCACEPEKDDGSRALCEAFCEDVKSGDTAKLMTYLQGTDVTEEALKEIIEPSDLNSAQLYYLKAINSTISYTVQDPVVDKQTKTATVYLSWREADYNSEETDQVIPAVSCLQGGVFHACHGTQPLPQEYDRRP